MKNCTALLLFVSGYCYGQNSEFKIYSNGLIYDQATMQRLGSIVDSLNVKFRTCDLAHPYYSMEQGMATLVTLPKGARKAIETGIGLEEFVRKYPGTKQEKLWITKSPYTDYHNVKYIEYSGLPHGWNSEPSVHVKDKKSNNKTSGWVVSADGSRGFYIHELHTTTLPFEYARLVQYVDCMIDTTGEIYFPSAKISSRRSAQEPGTKAQSFIAWAEKYPGKPRYPDYKLIRKLELNQDSAYAAYRKNYMEWDSLRMLYLDAQMLSSNYWNGVLSEVVDESIETGAFSAQLEFYVSRYVSKNDALRMMRSYKVYGRCSQDERPRIHAMNICQLSAETAQWDIFLRSHLDIMNDRFERMSDGSYAWAARKTYLKELEALDINAIDLLLGTSLRVSNVSDNHYWGSIGRMGRALADAEDKNALETRLIAMITDEQLDPYNRLLIAYLYSNYAANLEGAMEEASKARLETAVATMPMYIRVVWGKGR